MQEYTDSMEVWLSLLIQKTSTMVMGLQYQRSEKKESIHKY